MQVTSCRTKSYTRNCRREYKDKIIKLWDSPLEPLILSCNVPQLLKGDGLWIIHCEKVVPKFNSSTATPIQYGYGIAYI